MVNLHGNCALKPCCFPQLILCILQSLSKNTMGLCLNHSSLGKNSNLNASVLLKGAEVALWKRVAETCCITTLTFPVRIVYKQLWTSFLWALWTSDGWTGTCAPCLNKIFLLSASHFFSLVCFPDKQKSTNTRIRSRSNTPNGNKYTCKTYTTLCQTLNTCRLLLSANSCTQSYAEGSECAEIINDIIFLWIFICQIMSLDSKK